MLFEGKKEKNWKEITPQNSVLLIQESMENSTHTNEHK